MKELSPLQILLGNTTPGLRDLALATIQAEGSTSSGTESQRTTMDFTNLDTMSIKSNSK